ncbi:MAG: ATPase domain-containing protein, partial [Lutimonas sp.]
MSKLKIKYICSNCGYESLKWQGKCPQCEEWNTFSEEFVEAKKSAKKQKVKDENIFKLSEVNEHEDIRIKTGIAEFDRVLGGGLILGSVVLVGGDPGIGKSTLVMQAASSTKAKVLYVTG